MISFLSFVQTNIDTLIMSIDILPMLHHNIDDYIKVYEHESQVGILNNSNKFKK